MAKKKKTKQANLLVACPVRDLPSSRVDQSARCPIHKSSSPQVGSPEVVQYCNHISSIYRWNDRERFIDVYFCLWSWWCV